MKKKACLLLIQSESWQDMSLPGDSHTRSYFLECLEDRCAAFLNGSCRRFDTSTEEAYKQGVQDGLKEAARVSAGTIWEKANAGTSRR